MKPLICLIIAAPWGFRGGLILARHFKQPLTERECLWLDRASRALHVHDMRYDLGMRLMPVLQLPLPAIPAQPCSVLLALLHRLRSSRNAHAFACGQWHTIYAVS